MYAGHSATAINLPVLSAPSHPFARPAPQAGNKLDFLILASSAVTMLLQGLQLGALRALRVLRVLRAFRLVTKSTAVTSMARAVGRSLAALGNAVLVCFFFYLVFAILGVILFAGKFYSCNDKSVAGEEECVGAPLPLRRNDLLRDEYRSSCVRYDISVS